MKILFLDIETSPHISVHFGRWQQNIIKEHTLHESQMICWAAKWAGQRKVTVCDIWTTSKQDFLGNLWDLLDEADLVVGYNHRKFDLKRINAEFIVNDMYPPSPYQTVDLLQQVKKHFSFSSNKLKHVLKELGLSPKLEEGVDMSLWIDCCVYNKKAAQKLMKSYNRQDVVSTEELYDYMLGWITPHPNWGLYVDDTTDERPACPNCGSNHMVKHKVRRTKVQTYQQWRCESCGSYHRGRKAIQKKDGVLT